MRLKDKTAIITGGGSGIGRETAIKFAREGAKVAVWDINLGEANKTVKEISELEGISKAYKVDVTNRLEIEEITNKVIKEFSKIDILVNNAGITADATLIKMKEEQWDRVIDINLKGVFNCGQIVSRYMVEQGNGVILNAASVVGIYGNFGQTNYAASKWGVIGMTKTWAKELGRKGIRVNAVAPGFILTQMTAKMPEKVLEMMKEKSVLKRLGTPEDIANAYLFLASNEASFITGTVLSVDGGVVI
ncbi:3-oxoacyl-(acyl-carrier-protein) reductase FabG [[Clostridium] ultunense Esp]|uniref:3-oxoacyl-[acyl-carrier-protein] reductase n=1 Tax=[Clostridium] ultunense Esp TaxID=1288971 RepID=M1Z629_9FIRM|nr:3-oxoacyl-[acyl-carrier-protein] reductase [Schnuerera ultunensis]CCQ98250.1 3-oxoacyl-(acyl-carrier-protein) reductase FabG [[Clostridium] ultunense Esp]SHD75997.1 3-oxoacyl-[acyl-carrier-protein] reductase FabG [[Clostridium] ultunense Esp]